MITIRPMSEHDTPQAQHIIRLAFGTHMRAPDLSTFWSDIDHMKGRFGVEHVKGFVAEKDGELAGSTFATRWGSLAFLGPVSVRPDLWDSGAGQKLVTAACDAFDAWGVSQAGLFTFPESPKHVWTYGKFGFQPRFLTSVMAIDSKAGYSKAGYSRPGNSGGWRRYSELSEAKKTDAETEIRALTERLYPGLDLGAEIRTVFARRLGDTLLLMDDDSRIAGFAVCHLGAGTEAGADIFLVKFAAVMPGADAEQRFARLLDSSIEFAAASKLGKVWAGVNTAHDTAYRQMQQRGFRALFNGVTMHRPNAPGYSRPELFVIDDWR